MKVLICTVGVGKGTWNELKTLITSHDWEDIYVVGNEFSTQKFASDKPSHTITLSEEQPLSEQQRIISQALKNSINDTEVAVCITSGSGKEHFTLITAIMSLGLGIRFVMLEQGQLVTY